jgi:Uma2 family endonuclease
VIAQRANLLVEDSIMAALPNIGMTPIWHMSIEQYHAMIANGILGPDDPVEFLEGILVQKMSINPPHRIATRCIRRALEVVVPAGWYVDEQKPITLANSEPEPDVAVIRGDTRDYPTGHPGAGDVLLIVEAADASLVRDRILKKRIYAAAGIPFYWLLDLVNHKLEVYSEPSSGDYQRRVVYSPDDSVPVFLEGRTVGTIPVRSLLP